jgi:uncharacterized Zn finger protein
MGWYYGFKPYVSVAQRRAQALREMEKRRKQGLAVAPIVLAGQTIARTFWGKAWCDNLESYSDYENRLPRGRTYVRNGSVVHLEIHPGKITALVSGTELYKVEITISALTVAHWKSVKGKCAGQIGSLIELLQGRLSKSVMNVVSQPGEGLFPRPAEIEMKCSCPDWAGMCKHVAAVMYGVGARLDERPELLFLLRKVDHLELIAGAVDAAPVPVAGNAGGAKTIAADELAGVFGIEMAEKESAADALAPSETEPAKTRARAASKGAKSTPKRAVPSSKKAAAAPAVKPGKKQTARSKSADKASAKQKRVKSTARERVKQEVT